MRRLNWAGAALIALAGVQGGTVQALSLSDDPKAEQAATHGFLVGTFAGGNGEAGEKLARSFMPQFIKHFSLQVGDQWFVVPLLDGSFMIALPPGTHELRLLQGSESEPVYGGKKITRESFPLRRPLKIETGKVTTLGAMYFYEKDASPQDLSSKNATGRYNMLHADNGPFMVEFLQRTHPEVYAALADRTLYPAQPFLNDKQFSALHTAMARARLQSIFQGQTRYEPNMRYMVYGALGMAGHIWTDAQGWALQFRSFGLPTMGTVHHCEADATRYVCLTHTDWRRSEVQRRAFAGPHGKGERLALPAGASPISAHLFGTDGIVLGDYQYRLHVRTSAQPPWQTFGQESVKAGAFVARYAFGDAADGFFTYYEGNRHILTFTDRSEGSTREVPLPKDFKGGAQVLVTEQHLLIGPEWNLVAKSEVYRYNRQAGEWAVSRLPAARCDWMGFDYKDSKRLLAACGPSPAKSFVSFDEGASWFRE